MNLRIGIVGLPNAGKSTLFNALLKKQQALVANYPFATIEPNVGVVPVPDKRLATLATIVHSSEGTKPPEVPATVEFVDIAGLVKGASEGQGLGNKFLSHIREVHLICHVVRVFPDPSVVHVAGNVDAARDKEIIETELILADLQTLNKQVEPRGVKDKASIARWELIERLNAGLNEGKLAKDIVTDSEDREAIADLHLLTMKPVLYVANVSEEQLLHEFAKGLSLWQGQSLYAICICAKTEVELAGLSEEDQKAYLKELGLEASGLDRLIQKAYEMLGLISFLTAGVKEVRAWTLRAGSTALRASGEIHTDFMKNFIKADVVTYEDFINPGGLASPKPGEGGWKAAREVGKVRSEGKGYVMKDGDVVEFKVGA